MSQQSIFSNTIFALSSGAVPSGVAVVRLSGPHVRQMLGWMVGGMPPPREASLRAIRDRGGRLLDRGLVLFFPGPRSFTGEDCAELHLHGGVAVVDAVMSALAHADGSRIAEAGEFTRRAFLNGRVDLTEAEGLADLVSAETEAQRRLALDNAEGRQRALYGSWRQRLIHARAMVEAELDFSEEADVAGSSLDGVRQEISDLQMEIARHLDGAHAAEVIRNGFRVVILGPPNAGKSSLLNALSRRDVAIVTDVPGTTRDLIEVALDLGGVKVLLTDTAGIRESADVVERIGVARAMSAAEDADLILFLEDPAQPSRARDAVPSKVEALRISSKCDLAFPMRDADFVVSAHSGEGLDSLIEAISYRAAKAASASAQVSPARLRHKMLLQQCATALSEAVEVVEVELCAEELRVASAALGRITGDVDVEDLLDVIFSEFCIGK